MVGPLLRIEDLSVTVYESGQKKSLLDSVSLTIKPQTISALVGGSGSGKTTTGLAILRLLPLGLNISQGDITYEETSLLKLSENKMRKLRGGDIGMIFQEPLNAFNPVFSIGYQINEVLRTHTKLPFWKRKKRILELLDMVELEEPKRVADAFPHQLSGGMRQRAMIAQAIAGNAKLIIADEPTSNLDVTLQAKIMELFQRLKKELQLSVLLITHDLGLVAHVADDVAVMTNGKIVEAGETSSIMKNAKHEYTQQLMEAFEV